MTRTRRGSVSGTLRDRTWDAILEQFIKTGAFNLKDLPVPASGRHIVIRVLKSMESLGWAHRDTQDDGVWQMGETAEFNLNVSLASCLECRDQRADSEPNEPGSTHVMLRDEVWNATLEQVIKTGKFRVGDLPFRESQRHTVRCVLASMESLGWLRRNSEYDSTWRMGEKSELRLNVSIDKIEQSRVE